MSLVFVLRRSYARMRTAVSGMPPGLWHTVALRQQRYKKTFTNNRKYEYFQSRHIKTYRFCPEGASEGLRREYVFLTYFHYEAAGKKRGREEGGGEEER